jgi:superfamily II DNA/RNA helicase
MAEFTFEELNLNENILKGVYSYGFIKPSQIQINGIKTICEKKDCILQSQSGTGKTATYLLGILNNLSENITNQAIIISPTRELSNQIYNVATQLNKFTKMTINLCIGGTDIKNNIKELRKTNLIIGTIGRLYHMISDKKIYMNNMKCIILDEADVLLSDNNIDDKLKYILDNKTMDTQLILISATMSNNVFNFCNKYMKENYNKLLLKNNEVVLKLISQFYINVEKEEYKFDTLLDLYNLISTSQTIIFSSSIKKVEWLSEQLQLNNFPITTIHSNMTQIERNQVIEEFREGKTRILLTTDLLSRGIDIPLVNMVINYDLPDSYETYIHRIGRCGRFDKKGVAISLIKNKDPYELRLYENLKIKYKLDIDILPDDINKYL